MNTSVTDQIKPSIAPYVLVFFFSVYITLNLLGKYSDEAKSNEFAFYRHALIKGCVEDAGEYVFRRVENVEGVAQLRLRKYEGEIETFIKRNIIPYDLYGYNSHRINNLPYGYVNPPFINYTFFETPAQDAEDLASWSKGHDLLSSISKKERMKVYRYFGYEQQKTDMKIEVTENYLSQYAFIFKETYVTNHGHQNLIGSELIVFEMGTREVLGVREAYRTIRFGNSIFQCPVRKRGGEDRDFVVNILSPINTKGT